VENRNPAIVVVTETGSVTRHADLASVQEVDTTRRLVVAPPAFRPWETTHFRDLSPVSIPFFEESLWFGMYPGWLEVFDPPRRSLSPTSNAFYVARSHNKHLGWLLQVLPPHGRTSRHGHNRKQERFVRLAGAVRLGRSTGYHDEHDALIEPGEHHHLRAGEEASLMLLVIQWVNPERENGLNPLCMEDHHYQPDPLWF